MPSLLLLLIQFIVLQYDSQTLVEASQAVPPSKGKRLAIITGGTRGIGSGISKVLAASGEYDGLLLTYNTNHEAAESFRQYLLDENLKLDCHNKKIAEQGKESNLKFLKKVALVSGDLTTIEARDKIFNCVDEEFCDYDLATVVHNAGQYVGLTSDNESGIKHTTKQKFGNGSLLKEDVLDSEILDYYQKLYGVAYLDICERSMVRMKKAYNRATENGRKYRGALIGISSPGCNTSYKLSQGYDLEGSGKCVMEYANRLYALEAANYNINSNVIIPGVTMSDAWEKIAVRNGTTRDEYLSRFQSRIPMKEVIDSTDIGDTVKFLAGPGGGRFMTGLSLRVDAGLHLI
mmetsp:Transcript_16614/g.24838  ORF Transcript_16614/g.24838 Transcript_16614/m.24838 type:complete len:347 (-) Transcript_16614:2196-3236(-)